MKSEGTIMIEAKVVTDVFLQQKENQTYYHLFVDAKKIKTIELMKTESRRMVTRG